MTKKMKDLKTMARNERDKRLDELKFELVKARVNVAKTGHAKIREIKKLIARILTLNSEERIKK